MSLAGCCFIAQRHQHHHHHHHHHHVNTSVFALFTKSDDLTRDEKSPLTACVEIMSQERGRVARLTSSPSPASSSASPKRTSLASSPSPRLSSRASAAATAAARKKMSQPALPSRRYYSTSPGAAMASKKTSIPTLQFHSSSDDGGERSAYNGEDGADEEDATQRLETAVRKISRGGSPNLQRSPGAGVSSSAASPTTDPFRFEGLSGLARGYEQYRESLTAFRFPVTTEFGEASSDDLSSEWESCSSDLEHNNNSNLCSAARPMTPVLEMSEEVTKRALETVETANSQLAATKFKEGGKASASEISGGEDGGEAFSAPRKSSDSGGGGGGGAGAGAASRSESPPPRKLALPPAPTHRADQPKRVR